MRKALCIVGFLVLAAQIPLLAYDTSPSPQQVVPEVIWAAATGGGTWVTELQVTNFAADSADIVISFWYSGGSRGLTLNTDLAQGHSVRFPNILSQMQTLDPSFTYYGRVGALLVDTTSEDNGLIQAQAKTVNGNYGKTFPGLNIVAGNAANLGRPMIIQDLVQNAAYRTSVGIYNLTGMPYTVEFTIVDADNSTVGATFSKNITGGAFLSFNPFVQAGVTSGTYENCWLFIEVTAVDDPNLNGLMCYGSIANNYTNDTYALIAKMYTLLDYDTSPSHWQVVPEAIWAAATGGGTWVTELQITAFGTSPSQINVRFNYAGGTRGPFALQSGLEQNHSVRFFNILSELQTLDPSFTYYGRVGALYFYSSAANSQFQVQAKTVNGNFGKTFPGMTPLAGNTADMGRPMIIQDLVQNATYRTSVGVFNASDVELTVEFRIFDANNVTVGHSFIKILGPNGFLSFNPFTQAEAPSGTYENCWLSFQVVWSSASMGGAMCYGSIANNTTNDTYALIAKQLGSGEAAPPAPPVRY